MSKEFRLLLIMGFLLAGPQIFGQRLGLLPPSVRWKQLVDDSLRVIYPDGNEETARRVASLMLKFASVDPITKNGRYKRISVLLQPETNIANGYVGLAPYVSEFYLQPNENPFALGSLPWQDLLAIHEYRHVQQVNAANTGLSHIVKTVFGELAFTGLYNLSVPNWYREGDAVYAETKWTNQGRGRLSSFTLPFRRKLLEGDTWDYYTVRNGSYREYTPDHYPLGYMMVQYGNQLFGEETWDTILQQAPRFNHLFGPFSGEVQKRTRMRNKHLYFEAMNWFRDYFITEKENDIEYPLVTIRQKDLNNVYYDMNFPDVDDDGFIYSAITTFDKTTAIYRISPDGRRKKIISTGLQQDPFFDHRAHRLVWTELRTDPRWVRKDKNVIMVYDEIGTTWLKIVPEKGFYTPSLDRKGTRIVCLHVDTKGNNNLQIIDARHGGLLATLPNPENLYFGYPIWNEDETAIISTVRNDAGQMALVQQDIATGVIKFITHYSYVILGKPFLHGPWIFLTTSLDMLDQVFAVDIDEGVFYQVSDGNTAHFDPVWDPTEESIICSRYDLEGKKLVRLPGNPIQWKLHNLDHGIKEVQGASDINLLAKTRETREFEIKKYSPWFNALNVHSLTVKADDPSWGVALRSDNILNNISITGGYEYNRSIESAGPYLDMEFAMWYPVLTLGVSRISREEMIEDGREVQISNNRMNAGISLPLYYSSGLFQQVIYLSSSYNNGLSKIRPRIPEFEDLNFNYLSHRAIIINSRKRAYRQALPTWAQRFEIISSGEITGPNISQLYVSGDLALPALLPVHYILVHGKFLSQDVSQGSIKLGSPYSGARGFNQPIGKLQYSTGITYGLPIAYPDMGIGNIFYTKRVRLQGFYDVSYTNAQAATFEWTRSAGLEGIIDFEFPPISLGLRYSRLLSGYTGSPDQFEVFLPVQLF